MKNEFKQIAENAYYMTPGDNDRPALGYISCKNCSIMVDSGNSRKHAKLFISELQKKNLRYPNYLVLTHWHWDHIFGTSSVNAKIVANNITTTKMESLKTLSWTDEEFTRRIEAGLELKFCRDNMKKELGTISPDMIRLPDSIFSEHFRVGEDDKECSDWE